MIVKRVWIQQAAYGATEWGMEGWYLLGIMPLYIRNLGPRKRKGRKL